MKYSYYINPHARDGALGRLWEQVKHHFTQALPESEFYLPTSAEQCREMVAKAAGAGVCLVAVGGEGTMNAVANGILDSGRESDAVMALVPFGNVNDYARAIGMDKHWRHALQTLVSGTVADVGVTELYTQRGSFYSLNLADVGFAAATAKRHSVDRQMRWARGRFKYNLLALRNLIGWHNIPARVSIDDETVEGELTLLAAGYSPTLGGFHLVPDAQPAGPDMALTLAMYLGRLEMIRMMEKVKHGPIAPFGHLSYRRCRHAVIEAKAPLVCSVDGEVVDAEAWRVELIGHSGRLRFLVPPASTEG